MGLLEDWSAAEADQMELQQLLLSHYRSSSSQELEVTYERDRRPALTLAYTRAGALIRITPREQFRPEDAEVIRGRIEAELLADVPDCFGVQTIFAHQPITGFYRYRERFQLGPMPPEAPRPPHVGGKHPGRLEVRVKGSAEPMTRGLRASKELRKLELILGLLIPPLREAERSSGRDEWVYSDIVDGQITSEYRQVGYTFPASSPYEAFAPAKGLDPLSTLPAAEYYGRPQGVRVDEDLLIPDNLDASLDRVFALTADAGEKFLRACYWLHAAHAIHRGSMSSSFIALVSSIEALLPRASTPNCEMCGKPKGPGPTAQFKAFVEHHLPGAVPDALKSKFYSIRSELAHGDGLLIADHIGWGASHETANEGMQFGAMLTIARLAIYNWLWLSAEHAS